MEKSRCAAMSRFLWNLRICSGIGKKFFWVVRFDHPRSRSSYIPPGFGAKANTQQEVVQGGARLVAGQFGEAAGVVRGLQLGAEAVVFALMKGHVGLCERGVFAGLFADHEVS